METHDEDDARRRAERERDEAERARAEADEVPKTLTGETERRVRDAHADEAALHEEAAALSEETAELRRRHEHGGTPDAG